MADPLQDLINRNAFDEVSLAQLSSQIPLTTDHVIDFIDNDLNERWLCTILRTFRFSDREFIICLEFLAVVYIPTRRTKKGDMTQNQDRLIYVFHQTLQQRIQDFLLQHVRINKEYWDTWVDYVLVKLQLPQELLLELCLRLYASDQRVEFVAPALKLTLDQLPDNALHGRVNDAMLGCWLFDPVITQKLLYKGVAPTKRALYKQALHPWNIESLRLLKAHGFDHFSGPKYSDLPEEERRIQILNDDTFSWMPPLMWQSYMENLDNVKVLVEIGVELGETEPFHQWNALMLTAAWTTNFDIVKYLFDVGARLEPIGEDGLREWFEQVHNPDIRDLIREHNTTNIVFDNVLQPYIKKPHPPYMTRFQKRRLANAPPINKLEQPLLEHIRGFIQPPERSYYPLDLTHLEQRIRYIESFLEHL